MKLFKRLAALTKPRKTNKECYSVRDFPDKENLKTVLEDKKKVDARKSSSTPDAAALSDVSVSSDSSSESSSQLYAPVEWKLSTFDKQETEPQTMEQELKRLQNLQEYFVLDSAAEAEFDSITRLASMTFDTPIALVSLVDLGRQWFLSKVGLDADEAPRKLAFCAHVVVNKYNLLVVPDATQDIRFKNNPFVTEAPHIRFYAGAALVSPEGYKLGTLCIVSPDVRPGGLSSKEQNMLHEMARMVVNAMVARRDRLIKQQYEAKMSELGHSLVQASIFLQRTQKNVENGASLKNISEALRVQTQTCQATARALLEEDSAQKRRKEGPDAGHMDLSSGEFSDFEAAFDDICEPKTNLQGLVKNLGNVLESFPRQGPVTLELDAACPNTVVGEDLLLFRSALNLVSNSMQRCNAVQDNSSDNAIVFRIRRDGQEVVFETQDSGPIVSSRSVKNAFREQDSLLGPVATMVRTMGGTCGMRLGCLDAASATKQEKCIFWFRIPLEVPMADAIGSSMFDKSSSTTKRGLTLTLVPREKVVAPVSTTTRTDLPTIGDPFQNALMANGCLPY